MANATEANPMEREVVLTRVLDAPRALVWKVWTDAAHLAQWWGPHGFTAPQCRLDLRPGGELYILMAGPEPFGSHPMTGEFVEVSPPERLVYTNVARDAAGNALLEGHTTVTFEEADGKTTLTVLARAKGLVDFAPQMLAGMEVGWKQSLEKMEELISTGSVTQKPPGFY